MDEFMSYILGEMTVWAFAAAFFFAFIGVFLSLLIGTTKRDPNSERTPTRFSWNFLWNDNAKRIYKSVITTILVIFISLRFAQEMIGEKASMIYAFTVGLGLDLAIERIKSLRNK